MVVDVADTGATGNMCTNLSASVLYYKVMNLKLHMGNKMSAHVLGKGTALFSLYGKLVFVQNVLHIHALHI